jgi:hypothetical protein
MTTGTSFVDIHRKRLLGTTDFSTRLLDHLRDLVQESYERSYRTGVIYDSALTIAGAAADAIAIGGTSLATDGLGHLLDIATFGYQSSVKFENALGTDYQVGLAYTEIPDGVQINPSSGLPEYIAIKEAIGESADPDAVTDNTGTITFQIDSVCETGVSHAGRTARVYLKTPAKNAITAALAIEELTVAYTAGENRITTAGTLGQDTVSTDPADYTVVLLGPSVKKNATIKATDGFAYIGTVAGAGAGSTPSSFDITEQEVMAGSLSQLSHITRVASNDRLKIDVKAITGESGEDQIRVTDSTGAVKFRVDEAGNVHILGDLDVTGETTQRDLVQVISSETITDNLTAGDDDAVDSHTIKGEWKHTNTAGTANYFVVDGNTGRVGIGAAYNPSYDLNIGGATRFLSTVRIESPGPTLNLRETDLAVDAGGLWRLIHSGGDLYLQENTAAGGDFGTIQNWFRMNRSLSSAVFYRHLLPYADNALDLGAAGQEWRHLYIDGNAWIDTLALSDAAGEGCGNNIVPTTNGDKSLGSTNYRWNTVWSGQFDSSYSNDDDWRSALSLNRHSVTDTNARLRVANYYVQTDATMVDGFGGTIAYFVGLNRVGQFEWTRSGADDQVNFHWFLNGPTDSMTEQFRMKYDGGIESRSHLPFLDDTYDLGSPSAKWANVYVTNLNVGADINPASDLAFDLGQSDNRWLNLYARNIDGGPLTTDYVTIGGPVYFGNTYDAPPVGAMNGAYTAQVTVGAQGNWATYLENGQGRVNITWNAYYDGTNWRAWKGTGSGDGATRLNVADTSGAMSWKFYFDDTSPASDGAVLSLATLTTEISSAGIWTKKLTVESNSAEVWYREADVAVNAGGLWRSIMSSGDWILQENTAAGGDFSATNTWLRADQSAGALEIKAHVIPATNTTFDLGNGTHEWKAFYLSDNAGHGVAGNLVPATDGNIDFGSTSYRWRASYAASVYAISSSPRVYWQETDLAVDAGGLWRLMLSGGKLYLQQNTAVAGDFSTSDNWFYTETGDDSLRWYAHMVPQTDSMYDLGNAFRRWGQIYAEFLTLRHSAPRIHWDEDGVDPDDGGLWRLILDGGSLRLEENTAAAGDFSTTQYWIQFLQGTPEIQVRRTFAPWLSNQIDLGTSGRTWRDLHVDGIGYIDEVQIDSECYLQLNGGNPYLNFEGTVGSQSAFWFSRSANTFYFRIAGSDAILDINASRAEFGVDIEPANPGVQDLGSGSARWGDVYGTAANFTTLTVGSGVSSHLIPSADNTYDLGASGGPEWRHLYLDGVAYLDKMVLSTAATEGVESHFYPSNDKTYNLGTSGRYWAQVASETVLVNYKNDTASNTAVNWYRDTATVNNAALTVASFIAESDVAILDGFGGVFKYWLDSTAGLFNVATMTWSRSVASDQCNITWKLRDASNVLTEQLKLQYNGFVRTRTIAPFVNNEADLGNSSFRFKNAYLQGILYLGDDANFQIYRSGTSPYFKFDTGEDAFWFSRTNDRFYFRIDGNDTAFRIDAALTQVGGNFTPYTNANRTLGDSTHVWSAAFFKDLYMTGNTGLYTRKVLFPLVVGDGTGIAMGLQTGGALYVGAGEGASNVYGVVADTTESLHLCADQTISFWAGTDTPTASDRKMHIDAAGLVYIANGGAPTSGGAAKLNVGATGTAGSTDLRGSLINAYESSTLSSTIDTRRRLWAVGGASSNESWLTISQYRITGVAGWESAGFRIAHEVDSSADVGGYIQFGVNEFKIKGDWYPESDGAWELGTASFRWKHLYTTFQNTLLESTTITTPCAVFTRDPDTVGNNLFPVVRFNNAPSSAAATTGSGGYLDFQTEGTSCARIFWKYATSNQTCNLAFALDNGSVFADRLLLTYDGYAEFQCHVVPTTANTFNLGSAGARWANVWSENLYWKNTGTHTTFDDQDDLALIDQYGAQDGETIQAEKAGEVREIQTTKANLPWPMLGPKDPADSEFYIHAADSVTFLVGAIKQLHGKHKTAIAELKAEIAELKALMS